MRTWTSALPVNNNALLDMPETRLHNRSDIHTTVHFRSNLKGMADLYNGLDSFITASRTDYENKLGEFIEIPTISMDPERKDDIRRGAQLAKQYLEAIGATAEIVETPGFPVVFGE